MRCTSCLRNIAAGAEAQKMVVEYQQADGRTTLHGYMMPDGPIATAPGAMVRGWHSRCYWVAKKREARGDAVTGRVVPGGPTGYTIEAFIEHDDQVQHKAKIERLRVLAESMCKGVGDPQVTEAFNAQERGGPYEHQHHHRLDTYQLIAHLEYAHGIKDQSLLGSQGAMQEQHFQLHARQANNEILARRDADGETERIIRDWRPQHTVEIERGHE